MRFVHLLSLLRMEAPPYLDRNGRCAPCAFQVGIQSNARLVTMSLALLISNKQVRCSCSYSPMRMQPLDAPAGKLIILLLSYR